ncbi:MAG: thioredoxin family protein, partial [Muriicola sp.]|nr:thioredoxin family protein [Muriicola sp.]
MKLFSLHSIKFTLLIVAVMAFGSVKAQEVQWLSLEEATELATSEKNPKKIFIDVYTDWCGWCKKMDKDTFQNE